MRTFISVVARLSIIGGLIPLLCITVARLARFEDRHAVVLLETFMPVYFLGATFVLVVALIGKFKILASIAAVVFVCNAVFVLPEYLSWRPVPAAVKSAKHYRLYTHNILYHNDELAGISEKIKTGQFDVVFLQEITPTALENLNEMRTFEAFPYSIDHTKYGSSGIAIWSRTPLRDQTVIYGASFPQLRAVTTLDGHDINLVDVHLNAPTTPDWQSWFGDNAKLRAELKTLQGDTLIAGDFNSTYGHRPFRKILDMGFTDARMARGLFWNNTFPVDGHLGAKTNGFIRIDHVLTSKNIAVTSITEGPRLSSDHRSLTAEFAFIR